MVRIASYGPQIDQSHGENRLSHIIRIVIPYPPSHTPLFKKCTDYYTIIIIIIMHLSIFHTSILVLRVKLRSLCYARINPPLEVSMHVIILHDGNFLLIVMKRIHEMNLTNAKGASCIRSWRGMISAKISNLDVLKCHC